VKKIAASTLIASEALKLRTVRSTWLLVFVAQVLVVVGVSGAATSASDLHSTDTVSNAAAHVGLVSMVSLVVGVMAVAGEYRHRTIADTYLTTPQRDQVLRAKLVVYAGLGLVIGLASSVIALISMAVWWSAKGTSLDLSTVELWQTLGGCVLWNAAFAVIGVSLGALMRNITAAVAAALLWIALVEGLVGQLLGRLARWLPVASGAALGHVSGLGSGTPLPAWAAALTLGVYAVVLTAIAIPVTVRCDVS
jgi:ABC-2 type transport system permease protein